VQRITRREFGKAAAAGLLWLGLGPRAGARDDDWFSIVALPDTQYYSESHPEIFTAQTMWIRRNVEDWRIAMVLHEGDITNRNNDEEWRNADLSCRLLDGKVPYAMAAGNHDMGPGGSARNRDLRLYRKTFPKDRFDCQPGWGDRFGEGMENHFALDYEMGG